MGLRIRTNVASLNAQRRLSSTTEGLHESMSKLASGSRINKAADDAAGLAISDNLRAGIRALGQAKRNANDGVSLVQTAEGSLNETNNMLIRLRELAVQSSSDTISNPERKFIDKEFIALKDEIDRIANASEFNGTRVRVGNAEMSKELANEPGTFPMEIQVGKDYFKDADAIGNRNPVNIIKIDLGNINGFTSGEGSLNIGRAEEGTRVDLKTSAQASIATLDSAISKVSDYRSYLGAIQNRLNSTVSNLSVQVESMNESKSRVMDTDFAEETANYTMSNILQQAGTAVLGQANAQPQIALNLLKGL